MRFLPLLVLASTACLYGVQAPSPGFDGARAYEDLRQIVAIGPRPAGSPGAAATREYVTRQMKAAGIATEAQAFEAETPAGRLKMVNLRATIPGAARQGRIIIAGHYDTKRFSEFPFVGANDGGSSTALLVELARVLKNRRNAVPIELLFLDGEEAVAEWSGNDHTYGSRYYVDAARTAGTLKDIRAMILVDMIGDRELVIKRETNSTPWLTDAIWAAAKRLKRPEFVDVPTTVEDDHLEFLAAGVPSVDVIDLEYPDATYRYWHTREDTLDKCSAGSLEAVGRVLIEALPAMEKAAGRGR